MRKLILSTVSTLVVLGSLKLFPDNEFTFKLVMMGDSVTKSASAQRGSRISDYVQSTLTGRCGGRVVWNVINEGVGRETVRGALKRIKKVLTRENPEFVSLAYGLVDSGEKDPGWFGRNLNELISAISSHNPDTRIILMSTIPIDESIHVYGRDRFFKKYGGANRYINSEMNRILRGIALKRDFPFIDVFRYLLPQEAWRESISEDGIHPNPAGNKLAGEYIGEAVFRYFSARVAKDPGAIQTETDARQLMKNAAQRFLSSRGRALRECAEIEERAWRMCPYLPEITNIFSPGDRN